MSYSSNNLSSATSIIKVGTPVNLNTFSSFSFRNCSSLIDIPQLDTSNFTSFSAMFDSCASLNVDKEVIFNATKATDFSNMFNKSGYIKKVTFTNTSGVTNFDYMFYYSRVNEVSGIDFTNREVPSNANGLPFSWSYIQTISNVKTPENAVYLFRDAQNLKNIYNLDTSNTTNFNEMFSECRGLQQISEIDTSKGTSFNGMFYDCNSLINLPATLDTSDCTRFSETFAYCKNLVTSPKINTSKATLFGWMYKGCTKLQSVPVLDCSNVQRWLGNFDNCTSLTTVGGFTNLGKSLIESNHNSNYSGIGFNNCPLTRDSARNIFNGLYDIRNSEHLSNYPSYRQIHFSATTFDSLRDTDIAIATNKGWTVVRGI